MKFLFSLILCAFCATANAQSLVGFYEMVSDINSSTPSNLTHARYDLRVDGEGDYTLDLTPSTPFIVTKLSRNQFVAQIVQAHNLFENLGTTDFPLWVPRYAQIEYKITTVGSGQGGAQVGSRYSCSLDVEFSYNTQAINFNALSSDIEYRFEYDQRTFEYLGVKGKFATFKRRTMDTGFVTLVLTSKSTGREIARIPSENLGYCSDTGYNDWPVDPVEPTDPNSDWSPWSPWSSCSRPCNGGVQTRTRTCYTSLDKGTYRPCIGESTQTRACNVQACDGRPVPPTNPWPRPTPTPGYPAPRPTPVPPTYGGPMRDCDANHLRYKGVSISVNKTVKTGFRKFNIHYSGSLSNPFERTIKCDVKLVSSRGFNRDWEVIDQKAHHAVVVEPYRSTHFTGVIKAMSGKDTNGLEWLDDKGHQVRADNCHYID